MNTFYENLIEDNNDIINAAEANDIAHEAIAANERPMVLRQIRYAAEQGKFCTIMGWFSPDTQQWLEDELNFEVESVGAGINSGKMVKWNNV